MDLKKNTKPFFLYMSKTNHLVSSSKEIDTKIDVSVPLKCTSEKKKSIDSIPMPISIDYKIQQITHAHTHTHTHGPEQR